MVEQFRSWGFEAELAEYRVLFPTPRIRELELLEPTRYTARLREPTLAEDETSGSRRDRLPPTTRIRPTATSPASWST